MRFVITRARRGVLRRNQWYARIIAANGRVLFTSESYNNRGDCEAACNTVRWEASAAGVEQPFGRD